MASSFATTLSDKVSAPARTTSSEDLLKQAVHAKKPGGFSTKGKCPSPRCKEGVGGGLSKLQKKSLEQSADSGAVSTDDSVASPQWSDKKSTKRSGNRSFRLGVFRRKLGSESDLKSNKGASAYRTTSLGLDADSTASDTACSSKAFRKTGFCCSFRPSKSSKKHGHDNSFNAFNVQAPCQLLTPEYGACIGATNLPTTPKPLLLPESSIMPANSVLEQNLLSAVQPSSLPTRLRKLSKAFFNSQHGDKIDLMNDWEIGGTQNPWVCPSDRHLQLRAQLKSGWSVRTASARSPTNVKQNTGAISDAEQEQIRKVLARAEAGRVNEQQRIGKMVDRLEKMRGRATGNGVTQCLLCSTEFGLLASKSYAAMCNDCRKYVCQKNCGIETYDQKRGEPVFLCKICSEYREVMWKKSGAWFYKEMPPYVKPAANGLGPSGNTGPSFWQTAPNESRTNLAQLSPTVVMSSLSLHETAGNQPTTSNGIHNTSPGSINAHSQGSSSSRLPRQLPIPPDQQQRLKTLPRPRITPSWVHEKVQSSMSIEDDDESSSDSLDHSDYKLHLSSSALPRRQQHSHRSKEYGKHQSQDGTSNKSSKLHRFDKNSRTAVATDDTDESENESRRTTPSTSPRHSLATPSSYGGDDLSQNQVSLATLDAADAKSIDSGVVQSDHSAQQMQLSQPTSTNLVITSSPAPVNFPIMPTSAAKRASINDTSVKTVAFGPTGPTPPPIPPRYSGFSTTQLAHLVDRCASSASSSNASSSMYPHPALMGASEHRDSGTQQSEESLPRLASSMQTNEKRYRSSSVRSADIADVAVVTPLESESGKYENNRPNSMNKIDESASPTFMSSPEDDTSTLGSIQFNLTYLHDDKQLIIHLIRAKNLKAMDKNGFSDPYVKFHIIPGNAKATKLTSKTIEKTLNPEWHEELIYYGITEDDRLRKTLRITVLDRDRIGSDFLGETRVALKKLPLGQMKKFNLYLEHAIPIAPEKPENIERGKILMSICYNIQQGSLFVHIKRCAELLGMDSTGFSDPYCKVSLTPLVSKAHRQKTSIKKRTLNPEFNEILQFIVPFKDLPKKTLEIGVYDHDVGKHDDYIGGIVLSTAAKGERGVHWTQCIENPGKTFEMWHKLDPNN